MARQTRNMARAQRDRTKPAHRQTPHGRGTGPHQDRRPATAPRKNQKTAARGRYASARNPNARRMDGPMAQHHSAQRQTPHPRNLPIRLQHHPQRHRRNATRQNNPATIDGMCAKLAKEHRSKTVHNHYLRLKQVLDAAVRERLIPSNPALAATPPRYESQATQILEPGSRPRRRRPHSTPLAANTATWQIPTTTAKCGASCGTSCSRPA